MMLPAVSVDSRTVIFSQCSDRRLLVRRHANWLEQIPGFGAAVRKEDAIIMVRGLVLAAG